MDSPSLSDPRRLSALRATELLDTAPEEAFDRFTRIASKVLGVPVSLVSLIDADRQFFKSAVGLDLRETPLSYSFCQHVVTGQQPLIVVDAREHPLLKDNLAVRDFGVVAYLGVPLTTRSGETLGSFCAIDTAPRAWPADAVAVVTDLAEAVMTEIELRLLATELAARHREVMALELQRAELADLLVHDLRNPLTSIMGGLDLILGAPEINDETRADAALASEGAATLLRLVNDILDVNRCEAGRMLLALDQCAPAEIVRTAITQMAHLARRQGVDLRVTVANGLPPVLADGTKLRRLLVNLVANAIQHTPRGGRVAVTAQASASDAAIVLTVEDTGAGIPPEVLPRLFEKYGRAKQDRSSGMSTGLGLYFCKLVADAHGGRIEVCSRVGTGTVFTVTIPLCPAGSAGRASVF